MSSKSRLPLLGLLFAVLCPTARAQEPDPRQAVRKELTSVFLRLVRPLSTPAPAGKAWVLEVSARLEDARGRLFLAWDAGDQIALRLEIQDLGRIHAAFSASQSWLYLPEHDVLFASPAPTNPGPPLADCRLWNVAKTILAGAILAAQLAPLPNELELERTGEGKYAVRWAKNELEFDVTARDSGHVGLQAVKPLAVEARIRVEHLSLDEFRPLLVSSESAARREQVEPGSLRAMLATAVDMLCEKALWEVRPAAVPTLLPGVPRVDGHPVLVLRGTPEEIGREYGNRLRAAVISNSRRILYGIGLFETLRSGKWFPAKLKAVWDKQEKYIPERYRRELDALADAVKVPREHAYWTNLFPELFHCSGLGLRGKATVGGQLLHGRILDYMTEVGFQATAVVTVVAPTDRIAWLNVGYAGCIGTVTGMNERGLAMGEMGGRGEGHVDGMPMTFLMREIMERFETTEEAIAWMRKTPRTCEYFYVLSDAKTKQMAGIASYARTLAAERNAEDLQVIRPGQAHPQLPRAMEDVVLMSADARYERLAQRVKEHYGRITPKIAWEIMGEGVAMKSALHIALFLPETLDVWVAEASLDAQPAYTQPITKLNLRSLLAEPPVSAAPAASGE